MLRLFLFFVFLLFCAFCPASPTESKGNYPTLSLEQGSEPYLTRSEFEEFLKRYKAEHAARPASGESTSGSFKKGKVSFTPYGYVNLSLSYDSNKTVSGDYCAYALSPDEDDSASFQVCAKASRLGLLLEGPGIPCWSGSKTQAAFEIDFQGSLSIRSRPGILVRKAYVSIQDKYLKILAGQDWEVVSPLYPTTLNYTAGAGAGNIGYRRAMLRVDRRFELHSGSAILAQFAIADNVLRESFGNSGSTIGMGSWPVLQGRLACELGKGLFAHEKPIVLGFSGHIGRQRCQFDSEEIKHIGTWSFNVDLDLPVTKKLRVQAEYFRGENLAGIEGGILQGVDLVRKEGVLAQGGWIGLQYACTKKMQLNVCYMIDDPENEDLIGGNSTDGLSRTYNHCIFFNMLYHWSDSLMTGFEVGFWRTHWQKYDRATETISPLETGKPTRYELVTRYSF